jgi:hypothetical protein
MPPKAILPLTELESRTADEREMAQKWNTTKVVDGATIVFEFRGVSRTTT